MSIGSEEKAAVMRVMDRGILSGYQGNWSDAFYGGEEIKALEKEWAEYFGVKHAIAANSATSGLWMALAAIGLQKPDIKLKSIMHMTVNEACTGDYEPDEVIVSPYSMTCSASIPLHFGAKPVFADIEKDYYCLDPKSVEERITERTKAIIVVDLFGQPADYDEINRIAAEYGKKYGHKIYVIEDAAQAAGAKYKGKYAGTLGDIGVYSLNVHKHIQCGEGGVVATDDDDLAFKLRLLCNHAEAVMNDMESQGIKEEDYQNRKQIYDERFSLIGMNLRMTEIQAAIAREQLKKLDGILRVVRENAKYFDVKVRRDCEHAFYRYAFTINSECPALDIALYKKMLKGKIEAKIHYITPLYRMPLFQQLGYDQHQCPVCEEVEENIVLCWLRNEV